MKENNGESESGRFTTQGCQERRRRINGGKREPKNDVTEKKEIEEDVRDT